MKLHSLCRINFQKKDKSPFHFALFSFRGAHRISVITAEHFVLMTLYILVVLWVQCVRASQEYL